MKLVGTRRLQTDRLVLRRLTVDDAQQVYDDWASDPEVTRFLTWPTHSSVDVSRAVVGPWVAYGVWRLAAGLGRSLAVFLAAALGNLATYCTTSLQLALAFPDPATGFGGSLVKFLSIFAVTQVPLAVVEGILTVVVVNLLVQYSRDELSALAFGTKALGAK